MDKKKFLQTARRYPDVFFPCGAKNCKNGQIPLFRFFTDCHDCFGLGYVLYFVLHDHVQDVKKGINDKVKKFNQDPRHERIEGLKVYKKMDKDIKNAVVIASFIHANFDKTRPFKQVSKYTSMPYDFKSIYNYVAGNRFQMMKYKKLIQAVEFLINATYGERDD